MGNNLLNTLILAFAYLILFGFAEWLYHFRKVSAERTRKLVHFITGVLALLFPVLLSHHMWVGILCGSFLILLLLSMRFGFLPAINAVKRKTTGSLMYPLIVYSCFLVYQEFQDFRFYYLPILILAICDPLASSAGKRWPIGRFKLMGNSKTMTGSLFFLCSAFLLILLLGGLGQEKLLRGLLIAAITALISTIAEALTGRGYDNFTIPLAVVLSLLFFKLQLHWI